MLDSIGRRCSDPQRFRAILPVSSMAAFRRCVGSVDDKLDEMPAFQGLRRQHDQDSSALDAECGGPARLAPRRKSTQLSCRIGKY
jgi:hypothetical protein